MTTTPRTRTAAATTKGRPVQTMLADIAEVSISTAAESANEIWTSTDLHPGDVDLTQAVVKEITSWCAAHEITTLGELTGQTAADLLKDLTGIEHLTRHQNAKKAERLHQVRNTITALRGAALQSLADGPTRLRGHRPKADSLDSGLPTVAPRTQLRRRPLRDDEILLARTLVEIDLREDAPVLPLHAYLLGETGLMPMESTRATTAHLDDRAKPTSIAAPGVWKFGRRHLPLAPYAQQALPRTLPRLREGDQPLSYSGSKPGTAAGAASIDPVIGRFLARAGVTGTDITAKSLSLWRPDHLLRTKKSLRKALAVHGGRTANLMRDLQYTIDESTLGTKKVAILDHRGALVARVPGSHVRILDERPYRPDRDAA